MLKEAAEPEPDAAPVEPEQAEPPAPEQEPAPEEGGAPQPEQLDAGLDRIVDAANERARLRAAPEPEIEATPDPMPEAPTVARKRTRKVAPAPEPTVDTPQEPEAAPAPPVERKTPAKTPPSPMDAQLQEWRSRVPEMKVPSDDPSAVFDQFVILNLKSNDKVMRKLTGGIVAAAAAHPDFEMTDRRKRAMASVASPTPKSKAAAKERTVTDKGYKQFRFTKGF